MKALAEFSNSFLLEEELRSLLNSRLQRKVPQQKEQFLFLGIRNVPY